MKSDCEEASVRYSVPVSPQPPKLLHRMRDHLLTRHYSFRTETAYLDWVRRFILFHDKRHPAEMGAVEVAAFLTHLAVDMQVWHRRRTRPNRRSCTSRDVLHNSLRSVIARPRAVHCVAFLANSPAIGCKKMPCGPSRSALSPTREGYAGHPYKEVLQVQLPWLDAEVQAKAPKRLPVVLTPTEVRELLMHMHMHMHMRGTTGLIARLLYGTGMRLLRCACG